MTLNINSKLIYVCTRPCKIHNWTHGFSIFVHFVFVLCENIRVDTKQVPSTHNSSHVWCLFGKQFCNPVSFIIAICYYREYNGFNFIGNCILMRSAMSDELCIVFSSHDFSHVDFGFVFNSLFEGINQ